MESSRDDKLAATLSALRPAPRPAFAAELDERAAAGFPRRSAGSDIAGVATDAHACGQPHRAGLLLPAVRPSAWPRSRLPLRW